MIHFELGIITYQRHPIEFNSFNDKIRKQVSQQKHDVYTRQQDTLNNLIRRQYNTKYVMHTDKRHTTFQIDL